MSRPERLYIIDAMALAFRSFYAIMRPLTTKAGLPTSAVYGTAMFIAKLINEQKPDYLVAATDSREPTFRHLLYDKYKANRKVMPEDLAKQLPFFFQLLDSFNIKTLRMPGLEADDLIGSLAKKHSREGLEVFIVSGDKDFMQLVDERVKLYRPKKGEDAEVVDRVGVIEKFGVPPEQVIDALAIIGDASDNVPGVKGIGDKGAAKLITEFGSLEGIYENLAKIANQKQNTALTESREMAFLSRQLVTIKTDCEVQDDLEAYRCEPRAAVANPLLLQLYRDLEFKLLADKVQKALGAPPVQPSAPLFPTDVDEDGAAEGPIVQTRTVLPPSIADRTPGYVLANTKEKLAQVDLALAKAGIFAFDTETTGLDVINSRPIGVSLAVTGGEAFYVPLHARHLMDGLTPEAVLAVLRPHFARTTAVKVGHNLKFDLQMLTNVGLEVSGPFLDTMIMDWLLDASARTHGLDACCFKHFAYVKIKTSTLIGEKGEISMLDANLYDLNRYACEDADLTYRLYEKFSPMITEAGLDRVLNEVEMPLVPILAKMEQAGVYVDTNVLMRFSDRLKVMADELEARIYVEAGETFNINSPKQLGDLLFTRMKLHETLGVKNLKKTKTGFSTDESVLAKLAGHPLPRSILEYRTVAKLKNTYVDSLPQLVNPTTRRIHSSFHQTGSATGRLSSSDPNLQNIPIRTELGQEIRKAFSSERPDWEIVSADYSQVELRLLAHLAHEDALTEAFAQGEDIHRSTASRIFGVAPADVDPEMRSRAKAINFGIIYGMGPRRLAAETGVSMAEAVSFIAKYFASYPGIQAFIDRSIADARTTGGSRTILGRFRPIDGLGAANGRDAASAENVAVNSPIQGSAADLIKLAMIKIDHAFRERGLKARMLLQVHDELVFETPTTEREAAEAVVSDCMRSAMALSVPLEVAVGHGNNWLEAH